jgi:hypothetical protein
MFKQIFDLADIRPDARFFRLIVVIAVLVFVISKIPWMNRLIARVINVPDIRHQVVFQPVDGKTAAIVEVANLGYVKAENVFFHFQARNGTISDYFIESQDAYQIYQEDLENGILELTLARLAPGARFLVEVRGYFDPDLNQTYISITSDQGRSISAELPSAENQVRGYVDAITTLYNDTLKLIKQNSPDTQRAIEWANRNIKGFPELISFLGSPDFKTILTAVALLSLLIGIFFPRLTVIIPFIAAAGMALIANFFISLGFTIALTAILLLLPLLVAIINGKGTRDDFLIFVIFVLFALGGTFYSLDILVSAKWLAIPAMLLTIYLLVFISIVMPEERVRPTIPGEEHRVIIQTEQVPSQAIVQLNSLIAQISERVGHVEEQLQQQQLLTSQLSQRYTAIVEAFQKIAPSQSEKSQASTEQT